MPLQQLEHDVANSRLAPRAMQSHEQCAHITGRCEGHCCQQIVMRPGPCWRYRALLGTKQSHTCPAACQRDPALTKRSPRHAADQPRGMMQKRNVHWADPTSTSTAARVVHPTTWVQVACAAGGLAFMHMRHTAIKKRLDVVVLLLQRSISQYLPLAATDWSARDGTTLHQRISWSPAAGNPSAHLPCTLELAEYPAHSGLHMEPCNTLPAQSCCRAAPWSVLCPVGMHMHLLACVGRWQQD